jgi:hypothetical protein
MEPIKLLHNTIDYFKYNKGGSLKNMVLDYRNYRIYDKKLRQLDSWVNFKEYCRYYCLIDYKNKVVVDYGADVGSSSIYFLSKGAAKVFCYEIGKDAIKKYNSVVKYMPEFKNLNLIDKVKYNMKYAKGEVLKMDIEGAEERLLSKAYLENFKEFIIALHPQEIKAKSYKRLSNLLRSKGGFVYGKIFNKSGLAEEIWVKTNNQ